MLLEIFLESLNKFVCKHQFQSLQKKKKELAIHIDFSEHFNCKHAEQVQSAHFGASHSQVTLHTGVLYTATDGPTTQYCNWRNLYLFLSEIRETGFVKATRNFTEAGHGKAAPDGVGRALKCKQIRLLT